MSTKMARSLNESVTAEMIEVKNCKENDFPNEFPLNTTTSKETATNKDSGENTNKKEEVVPTISFITLYRFADEKDKISIILSILFSILCGCSTPINTILFADLLQAMVVYGITLITGMNGVDEFMEAVKHFALWNTLVGVAIMALTYGATLLMNMAAYNQIYRLRQAYLKAALNQDFAYFDLHKTGDLASKMTSDVIKVEDGIGEKLATFIFFQTAFISSVVMALIKGWKLTLLCLITFPVTMGLVGIAGLIASKLSKSEAVVAGKAGSIAEEVLSSIRTVYAFSGQKTEEKRYQGQVTEIRSINIKKGFFSGIAMGMLFFCIFCSYALSFWFGYRLMRDEPQNYDVSTMVAVFFGVLVGSMNFGISSTLMEVFGVAKGAGAQIFHLLDIEPTINPALNEGVIPDTIEGNIELENVVFHYPSRPDVPVLKGVNLSVKRGQSVALVGHSGCGKSTIIQLLSRYYDVINGSVSVDGNDVRSLSVRWLRAQVGLVGQEPVLFNTTVRDNIRYGREEATVEDIEAAARQANAHQFIMKLPKGYDTLVGERGASLSGGQKQRIAIARALVRNPRILLLDEATSALDLNSEAIVQKAIDKAQEGRTTIVVAHRLTTIRNVDVIYVFKDGEVVEIGNHVELMEKKGHYYDMVMIQSSTYTQTEGGDGKTAHTYSSSEKKIKNEDDEAIEFKKDDNEESLEMQNIPFSQVLLLNSPEWKSISLASISSLLSGIAMPILAIVLGDFIGALSNPNEAEVKKDVKRYALIFVAVGVFSGFANFIQVFFYAIAGEYLTERLRNLMFGKLLTMEVGFYDNKNHSTGALCAKLAGETAAVQAATGQRIGTILNAIGTLSFALILALYYEWRVGLVVLIFVPVICVVLYTQGRMIKAESFGAAKTMEESSKIAVEAVANVRTVASLGREQQFLAEYAVLLAPALVLAKRSAHIRAVVFGISRSLFNFVYAVSLYYGATLIVNDNVNYDLVLKSAQALLMGASSATQALAFGPNFQKGLKAAGRIIVLLNRQSKINDPEKPPRDKFEGLGEARLEAVHFRYPTRSNIPVLQGLNLEVERGKTIALVGASGCGKSTVIQLLERYYDPDEGIVAQDGISIKMLRLEDARRPIGFVQQEPILFDRTIGENIAYGDNLRKPTIDEICEAAKQANIHNFVVSLPMGYDTNIGSKGTQLSGGQKQRVAIARALIRRPHMLLLDEATSALDTESEKVVQEALDRAKEGRTCVMIAHRLSTVRDADAICVVHERRVAEKGTHHELIQLRGLYYNLNQNTL